MQDPQIILADEPIASVDPMNAQIVMDALRRIHEEDGRMVICNLPPLDTARRYCDRVIGLRDGRVVFDGSPEQLTTGAARDIYGADDSFSESATSTEIEALDGPVPVKVNMDGSIGYHSIGFARKEAGIGSLDDMEGKTFGFGDPNSASGYLIPSIEIPQATGTTMDSGNYLGEVKFTGGHEQTIVAVFNGKVGAGVTWAGRQGDWEDGYNSGALRKAVDAGLVGMNELVQIWKSNVIPEGPVVLRKALPDDVKATTRALVDGLHERDQDCAYGVAAGETLGFQPVSPRHLSKRDRSAPSCRVSLPAFCQR